MTSLPRPVSEFVPLLTPPVLPSWEELTTEVCVVRLPLVTAFRGVTHREALLLRGPVGWAEFSPFLEYETPEAAWWLRSAMEVGWSGYPTRRRDTIALNATVPAVAASDVPGVLARFAGLTTAKVKVAEPGQTLADDVARVRAVRQMMGEDAAIRVDANGGWTLAEATEALAALAPMRLEYAEQPVAALADLAALTAQQRQIGGVPVAADEAIRKATDPLAVIAADAADVAVLKVPPLGGPRVVVALAEHLAGAGMRVVLSSALDTVVGVGAGLAAAGALPQLDAACGLGTARLYAANVGEPPVADDGRVVVPTEPVAPDRGLMRAAQVEPERHDWWLRRLRACYDHIQAA